MGGMSTWTTLASPLVTSQVGPLRLESDGGHLTAVKFAPWDDDEGRHDDDDPLLAEARAQLTEYFAGQRQQFDLPVAAPGTDFHQRVWRQLRLIPYGTTMSYGQIAAALGLSQAASRAVGLANGRNPVAIVVPCHRVIGADGTLTGYGGGLARKRALLSLESTTLC
jgi:methylated-DNA-[protein]-cysteine S-methyltransferase